MGVNWKEVDPTDFEKITRELLTREFNTQLESFAVGRDDGIDLRADNGSTIIQCKRITTGYSSLLSKLKQEAKKEAVRAAKRYVVVTCVDLTPQNKEEIRALFPNIHTTEDILGGGELEGLIAKYEEIRKLYPVLWLGNIQIITDNLRKVMDKPIDEASAYEMEKIHEVLHYISVPQKAKEALKILKENKAIIITGKPGIGKTTLARYLVGYLCVFYQYEFVFIESNIRDAYQKIDNAKKQIFLYDDFLGTTFINDKLEKNEERKISRFIEHIQSQKNKLIIFTTREYIYQQACYIYGVFSDETKFIKILFNIEKNEEIYKAGIFYNHLKRANIPRQHIQALFFNVSGKRWGKGCYLEQILENENYNPRLVAKAACTSASIINPADFPLYILKSINNPYWLYEHAFESQLDFSQKAALIVLGSFPEHTNIDTLREAWVSYLGRKHDPTIPFERSLHVLDTDFIVSSHHYAWGDAIEFVNPGVRDFIHEYFHRNPSIIENIIRSSRFPKQIIYLSNLLKQKYKELYDKHLNHFKYQALEIIKLNCASESTTCHDVELAACISSLEDSFAYFPFFEKLLSCEKDRKFCDVDESTMSHYCILINNLNDKGIRVDCIPDLIEAALSNSYSTEVFGVFDELSGLVGDSLICRKDTSKGAADWDDNYSQSLWDSDSNTLEQELENIESLSTSYPNGCYGICFDGYYSHIKELIAKKEEEEQNEGPGDFDDYDPDRYYGARPANHSHSFSEDRTSLEPAIIAMFERYSDS